MKKSILTLALMAGLGLPALAQVEKAVNINTGSVQELQLLPKVGPALAQRIVAFREAEGPFKTPEELMRVKGVGEKTFALLKPYVVTSGPTTLKEKVGSPKGRSQRQKQAEGK